MWALTAGYFCSRNASSARLSAAESRLSFPGLHIYAFLTVYIFFFPLSIPSLLSLFLNKGNLADTNQLVKVLPHTFVSAFVIAFTLPKYFCYLFLSCSVLLYLTLLFSTLDIKNEFRFVCLFVLFFLDVRRTKYKPALLISV